MRYYYFRPYTFVFEGACTGTWSCIIWISCQLIGQFVKISLRAMTRCTNTGTGKDSSQNTVFMSLRKTTTMSKNDCFYYLWVKMGENKWVKNSTLDTKTVFCKEPLPVPIQNFASRRSTNSVEGPVKENAKIERHRLLS